MKKIILVAALFVTVGSTYANTLTTSNVLRIAKGNPRRAAHSPASIATFNAMFPGATNIKWQIKGELGYGVTFVYEGVKMTAVFSFFTGAYIGA
jgi:hypothetical protein